jgi:hypothetical protein
MLDKEQWLEVGAMEMDTDGYESIHLAAIEVIYYYQKPRKELRKELCWMKSIQRYANK